MPGRIARTQTAVRVADFLASREGKAHLSQHGWTSGMPIVMTQASESVDDAMGMASIHGRAVLMAMLEPKTDELRMLYVTAPQSALLGVNAIPEGFTMGQFFDRVATTGILEFRVKFWRHTAVAHLIPSCSAMLAHEPSSSRYRMTVPRPVAEPLTAGTV